MVLLHCLAQIVDVILERLDGIGLFDIAACKRPDGKRKDLLHRCCQHAQLGRRVAGKADLALVHLLGDLGGVHRVVADTLKVADRAQEL